MTSDTTPSGYSHTQKAPTCLFVYGTGVASLVFGIVVLAVDESWSNAIYFVITGVGLLLVGISLHHLTVEDQGDHLAIRFGLVSVIQRTVRYCDIERVEVGRTLIPPGWGLILWGRICVIVRFKNGGMLRIGTDDAENLAAYLRRKAPRVDG